MKNIDYEIKTSMREELADIRHAFEYERKFNAKVNGVMLYNLKRRDSFEFMRSDELERISFGAESGLYPNV